MSDGFFHHRIIYWANAYPCHVGYLNCIGRVQFQCVNNGIYLLVTDSCNYMYNTWVWQVPWGFLLIQSQVVHTNFFFTRFPYTLHGLIIQTPWLNKTVNGISHLKTDLWNKAKMFFRTIEVAKIICGEFKHTFGMSGISSRFLHVHVLTKKQWTYNPTLSSWTLQDRDKLWDISGFEIGRLQSLSHFDLILIFEIMMFEITNFNFILRQYKQIAKLWYPVFKITSIYRLCFICKQQILTETQTPFFLNWECMYMY